MRLFLIAGVLLTIGAVAGQNSPAGLYRSWLDDDVAYIITAPERGEFQSLQTDLERQRLIEQFWLRRDPTPKTVENEFKDEHYRRMAFANEHYGTVIPGWKTDRGRIYITFGPPDEIESGNNSAHPFERWRYRFIEGIGNNVDFEFLDTAMSGEFHLTADPTEKRSLPSSEAGFNSLSENGLQHPPKIKFRNLEAMVNARLHFDTLPMKVRLDFVKITGFTVLTNVTLRFEPKPAEDPSKSTISIYARVITPARRAVEVFEADLQDGAGSRVYQKSMPLAPGSYHLSMAAGDVARDAFNNYEMEFNVPQYSKDRLSNSSLILAGQVEKISGNGIPAGQFVVGDTSIRPRMTDTFELGEKLGVYVQLYHFAAEKKTHKPNGSIQYQIVKKGSDKPALEYNEDVNAIQGASAQQVSVIKLLPLQSLAPGLYSLRLKATDHLSKQVLALAADFTLR